MNLATYALIDSVQFDLDHHKALYTWLSKNPGKEKQDWPDWKSNGGDIPDVKNWSFTCDYNDRVCELLGDSDGVESCTYCPYASMDPLPCDLEGGNVYPGEYARCAAQAVRTDIPVRTATTRYRNTWVEHIDAFKRILLYDITYATESGSLVWYKKPEVSLYSPTERLEDEWVAVESNRVIHGSVLSATRSYISVFKNVLGDACICTKGSFVRIEREFFPGVQELFKAICRHSVWSDKQ